MISSRTQTAQGFVLNRAPAAFNEYMAEHAAELTLTPSGAACFQCGGSAAGGHRRVLAGGGGGGGGGGDGGVAVWCKRCDAAGVCDALPVPGQEYWLPGQACNAHPDECPCEMMMSADAFSITVWALVLASVLAPLGFGVMLRRHMRHTKQQAAAASASAKPATTVV